MTGVLESARPNSAGQTRVVLRIVEILLPLCVAAMPYARALRSYVPESISDAILISALLFSVLLTASVTRMPPGLVLLGLLGFAAAAITVRPNLMAVTLIPLIVYVLHEIDIFRVFRIFLVASVLMFVLITGAYLSIGFNSEFDVHMWREYSSSFVDRRSFGFTHPNRAMPAWAVIAIATLAISEPRRRIWLAIPISAVTAFLYLQSDSRTSTLIIAVVVVGLTLGGKAVDRPVGRNLRAAAVAAPIAFTFAPFLMSALATNVQLNTLLSGRPAIYANLINTYSIFEPWGSAAVEDEIVDSGYLQLVLAKGLVLTAVYILTLTLVIHRSRPSWRSVVILGAFLSLSLTETALMDFAFLFVILFSLEVDRRADVGPAASIANRSDSVGDGSLCR